MTAKASFARASLAALVLLSAPGCGGDSDPGGKKTTNSAGGSGGSSGGSTATSGGSTSTGGTSSTGGSSGAGGSVGSAGTGSNTTCPGGTPVPAGTASAPNLTVQNWNGHVGAISFTIDDALGLNNIVPALAARSIVGTFYLICNNVMGNPDVWKAVADAGNEVTNHTMSHAAPDGSNLAELTDCDDYLKNTVGVTSYSFAYPYSNAGEPFKSYTSEHYIGGRGGSAQSPPLVKMTDDPDWSDIKADYTGPGGDGTQPVATVNAGMDAAVAQDAWYVITTHAVAPEGGYAQIPAADYESALDHAVASNAWIGTFAQVAAYARGQKALTAAAPAGTSPMTWTWTAAAGTPEGTTLKVVVDGGTLSQGGTPLEWDCEGGFYPVDVLAGELTWTM